MGHGDVKMGGKEGWMARTKMSEEQTEGFDNLKLPVAHLKKKTKNEPQGGGEKEPRKYRRKTGTQSEKVAWYEGEPRIRQHGSTGIIIEEFSDFGSV